MNSCKHLQLLVLAALWGASFLFIRVGVPEFGVAPLMALRVGIGALFLISMLVARRPRARVDHDAARARVRRSSSSAS